MPDQHQAAKPDLRVFRENCVGSLQHYDWFQVQHTAGITSADLRIAARNWLL